ncbi:cytochrome P450 [Azospirillum sp. B4]|uniref:cytochrome P450 n=1 Tax=Azospirillum sp. B4 TaxID=95605 RepID=UPI00034857AC|nr:cytochrome P450 [Azospirillum sp. B4]
MTVAIPTTDAGGLPPGPRGLLPALMRFANDPVGSHARWIARYGDPFTQPMPGFKMVVTGRADVIQQVLALPPDAFGVIDTGAAIMGRYSLVRLDGATHQAVRRQVGPLVMEPLRDGNGLALQAIARRLFAEAVDRPAGPVVALTKRLTMEVILRSVLNLSDPATVERFASAYATLSAKASFLLHFLPALQIDLGPRSPWGRIKRARRQVDTIIGDVIDAASAEPARFAALGPVAAAAAIASEPTLGTEALRHQVFTLLSAGHSSTAQALAWAIHHAWSDPARLARLRAELDPLAPERDPGRVIRLPYLNAFCREVLRFRPIGPVIGRKLKKPIEFGGWSLPAGTMIGLSVVLADRDPAGYADPNEFRPERFIDEGESVGRSIAFGGGVRHCLGANLALTELKLALAELVADYDVTLLGRQPERHRVIDAVAGPAGGVKARISRRGAT